MARLILHIGTHKTATTSIQRFLAINRTTLAERGIFYPGYNLVGKTAHYAHLGMVNALSGQHKSFSAEDGLRFFGKVRERMVDYDTTIISAEPFYRHIANEFGEAPGMAPETYWPARHAYIARIREIFGEAEIAVVFRRQADYAQSLYQEHIKVTRYLGRFRDFLSDFWFHFAFLDQMKAWQAVFPTVRAMTFEKLVASGDAVGEFARLLGLTADGLVPAERHNEAMSADLVILKRMLQAGPGDKDEFRRQTEALDTLIDPAVLKSVEPRSFFGTANARRSFQLQFADANEAMKPLLVHDFAPDEPTFPKGFKPGTKFGDSPHPAILAAITALALCGTEAAPAADQA